MKTFLAPMAGYSDRVLRDICRNFGADVVFTEMINCHTVVNVPGKSRQLLQIHYEDHPIAVQLFGNEADMLSESSKILESWGVDYIDLNVGCPVKKIVKSRAGSALLKNLSNLEKIVGKMRKNIKKALFSIKIRTGWNSKNLAFNEAGKIAQNNGVDYIIVHGRTRSQQFSGKANWDHIKELKKNIDIPVIGNGDISSKDTAYEKSRYSNVDGIMIGRKAIERPYIFKEIKENKAISYSKKEIKKFLLNYYEKEIKLKGECRAINEMRKIAHRYIRGWKYAKKYREKINQTDSFVEIKKILEVNDD